MYSVSCRSFHELPCFTGLVTSASGFNFKDGNPEKEAVVITFKDGKEVEAK